MNSKRLLSAGIVVAATLLAVPPAVGQPAPPPVTAPEVPEPAAPSLPPGVESPLPKGRPVTLKEAIAVALKNQPQVALSRAAVAAASGRTRQAVSGLLPSVSVSAQHTTTGPARGGGAGAVGATFTTSGYTENFSGRQLVYDFGRTIAQVSQSRRQEESARQGLAQTRQDMVNQVKQSYYLMLQDQRLVGVQRSNVDDQQAHLDLAKARFDTGLAPRADVVRAETAVAAAILDLVTAQNTAAVSRVNLNLAMGIDVRTPTRVEETQEPTYSMDPQNLVEQALTSRPDVKQARASATAAEEALRAARTTDLPAFYLSGNYGFRGTSFPPSDESWSYGVVLQWSLFDAGLTAGRVREAQGNVQSARANLKSIEQSVSSDVVQAYLNVQTASQKVTAANAEVANAQESMELASGRYQAGVAVYIEVIDAETALVTAKTSQVNALYGLSTARAALQQAVGIEEEE